MKINTGCYLCKHLEWEEVDYEDQSGGGWYCSENERSEDFKTFPCKRKLKCRELKNEAKL